MSFIFAYNLNRKTLGFLLARGYHHPINQDFLPNNKRLASPQPHPFQQM